MNTRMIAQYSRAVVFIALFIAMSRGSARAQHDTTYYRSFPNHLTTRFYFSQKYTALTLKDRNDNYTVNYRPNTTLNMGVGATYDWATINLAYGFGFLNPDEHKAKTKYVDLQFHGYGSKFNLDVLGQFYQGFYLSPKGLASNGSTYDRPDLKVTIIGASFQYIVNHKRFSFRSSVLQNEWQRKSAGTILLGIEAYGGAIRADSSIVPTAIHEGVAALNERRHSFFEMGPNIGYAYTLVIRKSLFLTASVSGSLDYGFTIITSDTGDKKRYGLSPNTFIRLGTGYNTAKWAISAVYVNNGVKLASPDKSRETTLNSGNVRLHFVYRLKLGRNQKKLLKEVIK
jgi:Domain of unknown function (DUF4421)